MRWILLPALIVSSGLVGSPIVPGQSKGVDAGVVCIGELRCAACHEDSAAGRLARRTAPKLNSVGHRLNPQFLMRFLANPAEAHPGTKMPDLLTGRSKEERANVAEALTYYLVSLSSESKNTMVSNRGRLKEGERLFHEIGCLACHGKDEAGLGHIQGKYQPGALSDFLYHPLKVRQSGRMPDFGLSRTEADDLAAYLANEEVLDAQPLEPKQALVEKGSILFRELNCTACHSLDGGAQHKMAMPLLEVRSGRGCLAEKPSGVPDFSLSAKQRKDIAATLAGTRRKPTPKDEVVHALTAFNCIACHRRDGFGGPSKELLPHLKTTQAGLGDHAKVPPDLSGVGASLKTEWMHKVLFDHESARPYMQTRMPNFGEVNLGFLPSVLASVDSIEPVAFPEPGRRERGSIRSAGHKLVGDKGLNCVACHTFNGKIGPGFQGMDLLSAYERLQPSWFYGFMLNPAKYRPGIVMPNYWSNGKGTHTDILGGDADSQVRAIWHYLSYGQGAPTPAGIHNIGTNLEVDQTVLTYRGRSSVAGYRGIAVGFPGGFSYAFNAETGALAALWRGDFVSVSWGGQGAGNFNPRGRAVRLSQDFPLLKLEDDMSPWPKRPVMNKENLVNPNPLYPKNLGYRFLGYEFDNSWVPTFLYQAGDLEVRDRSNVVTSFENPILRRQLIFTAKAPLNLHFRVLTGKIVQVDDKTFRNDDLQVRLAEPGALLRAVQGGEGKELILKLDLPVGQKHLSTDYELLR